MANVFTPDALHRSFKSCRLADVLSVDADEVFYFRYPSPNVINEANGDGDLFEIWDYYKDWSKVVTEIGEIPTTPDTIVYYR